MPGSIARVMQRSFAVLLLVAGLAACTVGGNDSPRLGQGPDTAVARFIPGNEVTVIQVTVSDRRPVRAVDLLGPNSVVLPAYSIDANRAFAFQPTPIQPSFGLTMGGGFGGGNSNFGSGVGVAMPFGGGYGVPGSAAAMSGQIQSMALIRLVNPQDYTRTWQDSKIRIQLGDPPDVNFITLQAPAPTP